MSDVVASGLFTIVGALIGAAGTMLASRYGKSSKRLAIQEFGIENLTLQLKNLGFEVSITKNGQPLGSVFQQRLRLRNFGSGSIDSIEVHFIDKKSTAKILGVNFSTTSPVSQSTMSLNRVSDFHVNCVVGHLNPRSSLDLFALYDSQPGTPNYELKTTDFVSYGPGDLVWRERRKKLILLVSSALAGMFFSWTATHNFSEILRLWP